ncbi:MAG TPA: peptidoglycan editing factor PgeF [Burkholderiaceae bacterium]
MHPDWLIPDWPAAPRNVRAVVTTRAGGVSRPPYDDGQGGGGFNPANHVGDDPSDVARNRALLAAMLPGEPLWLEQVHGIQVCDAGAPREPNLILQADASVTDRADVVCAIMTADCLPVLLSDRDGKVVAAAHAGWRGLAGGVLEATVAAMNAKGASEIVAWLGPAIGPGSFEVGAEVRNAFAHLGGHAAYFTEAGEGKFLADIYGLARAVLAGQGVLDVAGGGLCTVRDPRFYSYRRDRITGRMAALIWSE